MMNISISERSSLLMHRWVALGGEEALLPLSPSGEFIEQNDLMQWFKQPMRKLSPKLGFLLEELRIALMEDVLAHLGCLPLPARKKTRFWDKLKLSLLALAGIIVGVCEGFDGIAAIFGLFVGIPAIVIFSVGFAFSLLSIAVFFAFDLIEISKNIEVPLRYSNRLLDVFLEQINQIKCLRKNIQMRYLKTTDPQELDMLYRITDTLTIRYKALDEPRAVYREKLNHPILRTAKVLIAIMAGMLFFGGGLSIGQTLSLAIAGLWVTAISATAWPILLTSIAVGIAAFSIYWYVERPGFENLVGRWFGLNKEHVQVLVDEDQVRHQKEKLSMLASEIIKKKGQLAAAHSSAVLFDKPDPTDHTLITFPAYGETSCSLLRSNSQDMFDEGDSNFPLGDERGCIQSVKHVV